MQQLRIILVVNEDKVGAVLSAIEGKVVAVDFQIVKLLEYHKRKPRSDRGGKHKKKVVIQNKGRKVEKRPASWDYSREKKRELIVGLLGRQDTPLSTKEIGAKLKLGPGTTQILQALVRSGAVTPIGGNTWRLNK